VFASILSDANLFFLVAARILALVETAPLLSTDSVPQVAKVGLAGFAAACVFPAVKAAGYPIPADGFSYLALLAGEVMVGLIMGFFVTILFAAFSSAGQYFSLQVGLGASEAFDPLAQIELPLLGQFMNLVALYVFLAAGGMRELFLVAVKGSFGSLKAIDLVLRKDDFVAFLLEAGADLFKQSLVLAMPILGTLFIVSLALGLMSKAAPQMNVFAESFPLSLATMYLCLIAGMPFLIEAFAWMMDGAFRAIAVMSGAGP
jgi:flagellar biosynthetic protein FliR